MTTVEVSWREAGELARHNKATEVETGRHNRAMERETERSNIARERETNRNNLVMETINQQNADSNRMNAESNRISAQAARTNAAANYLNAQTNALNGEAMRSKVPHEIELMQAQTLEHKRGADVKEAQAADLNWKMAYMLDPEIQGYRNYALNQRAIVENTWSETYLNEARLDQVNEQTKSYHYDNSLKNWNEEDYWSTFGTKALNTFTNDLVGGAAGVATRGASLPIHMAEQIQSNAVKAAVK